MRAVAAVTSAAARLVHGLGVVTDPARLRCLAQHALGTTAAYALVLTLAAVALVFALLAAHAGLRLVVPAWAAALSISGVFVVLALVAWGVARRRARAPLPAHAPPPSPVEQQAIDNSGATLATATALAPLLDAALAAARARPGETMLTALAAGIVADSLRRGRPR